MRKYRSVAAAAAVFALVFCLAAAPAVAQDLKLVGPEQAELNRPFEISVEGLALPLSTFQSSPPQITWLVLGGEAQVRQRMELTVSMQDGKPVWSASPYVSVTPAKAGACYVVFTYDPAGKFAQQTSLEVTIGPFPDPGPDPEPDPKPDPTPGKRWVILIEESSERTPQLAWVMTSSISRDYLAKQGHEWRAWDRDHVPEDGAPYLRLADGKAPTLFIVTAGGSILYRGPPPADPESLVALVKKHGG